MIVWVIGAGGLLGSAVVRAAREQGDRLLVSSDIPWSDQAGTVDAIRSDAVAFKALIDLDELACWSIIWAAGRATTASSEQETAGELATFRLCLDAINEELHGLQGGVFALASSAGGVYAGSSGPPFTSHSTPRPLGDYGRLKMRQERVAREKLGPAFNVLIARFANLYGPGQDIEKLQGLISQLALTSVIKRPLTMFVPLDTLRDYIFADDAAARLLHWVSNAREAFRVRVIASGQPTTLGYLLTLMKDISRTTVPIAYGLHASAAYQSQDLRLLPDTDATIESLGMTTLPAGLKTIHADMLQRSARGMKRPSRTAR